jgi:hypothetical protein
MASLPLLHPFHSGANNLRHQLLLLVEVNMSKTMENFVRDVDKNNEKEFIATLRLSI